MATDAAVPTPDRGASAADARSGVTDGPSPGPRADAGASKPDGAHGSSPDALGTDAQPGVVLDGGPSVATDLGIAGLDARPAGGPDAVQAGGPDAVQAGGPDALQAGGSDAVPAGGSDAVPIGRPDVTPGGGLDAVVGSDAIPPDAGPALTPDAGTPDAAVLPPPDDPHGAGPRGVQAVRVQLQMPGGGLFPRRIDLFIDRPADPAGAPHPLILFSHGFQLAGDDYRSYAERWASHGFVVVAPTYDGLLSRNHAELAQDFVTVLDWVLAQNADPAADLFQAIDPARIGAAGHSRGGKQSFFGALLDPRVGAVFGFDPVDSGPPFGGNAQDFPSLTPERVGELHIPTAVIGSERGPDGLVACAPGDNNWDDYYGALNSPSFAWLISGSGHMDFMDACNLACLGCPGGDDPGFTREFSRATSTAFFRYFLNGEAAYRPWLDGDAARVDARVQGQSK